MTDIGYSSFLVVQTAFPGDVILTLPLIQVLKKNYPDAPIDVMVIPKCAELLTNHPSVNDIMIYDKRGSDSGFIKFAMKVRDVRKNNYNCAFVPHRSLRSALLVKLAGIPERLGFDKSSGKIFFTKLIPYDGSVHEIDRNCSLLRAIGINPPLKEYPSLYPSFHDKEKVNEFLSGHGILHARNLIGIAPGSVWKTKRWTAEGYIGLAKKLTADGYYVTLVGGTEDADLCERIRTGVGSGSLSSAAGIFTFLQSAELINRCSVLISNDSAPMHIAVAMRTPVVAIFGATVPEFGFGPYGDSDVVVEIKGLKCRPCGIHGGDRCPIGTFDCMDRINVDTVYGQAMKMLSIKNKSDGSIS